MGKVNDNDGESGVVTRGRGLLDRAWGFLREVQQESTKVTWPNRKETLGSTGIIIAVVILVGVYLGLVDYLLTVVVQHVLG